MNIKIHVDTMKDAERLSDICKKFPNEILLRADTFCIDPKSTLGILAMMYSARDRMYIDTADMADKEIPVFTEAIGAYLFC
jgi:hypothetical protein